MSRTARLPPAGECYGLGEPRGHQRPAAICRCALAASRGASIRHRPARPQVDARRARTRRARGRARAKRTCSDGASCVQVNGYGGTATSMDPPTTIRSRGDRRADAADARWSGSTVAGSPWRELVGTWCKGFEARGRAAMLATCMRTCTGLCGRGRRASRGRAQAGHIADELSAAGRFLCVEAVGSSSPRLTCEGWCG